MTKIQLSICMPTYNFGNFIGETIESILPQMTDEIENVILDGGSTDHTQQVVEKYISQSVIYHRLSEKGGIDFDLAKTVSIARGEYCWLFSSDDVMQKDAISKIIKEIKAKDDVYICGFTLCQFDIKKHVSPIPLAKYTQHPHLISLILYKEKYISKKLLQRRLFLAL